ncbi:hypothetical protein NQ317_013540 [Molorchus minor]|uniref:G-patch domain-containing protein n=1 Tax=Molorchus minor TaxID=1323400 RepID=A0ABQ9JY05_9CUCU|nr:hypothetical protein NQ317_013540 [Molorchus minor]
MSMLAERKRKQKWSLNPRGKDWAQDANKFGQKMLEKMGWQQGKGLGAKEDGITDNIKVSYKNDSKGMGYKESNDQWTAHEVQFTALLESLSGAAGKSDDIKQPNSLEKKSQSSRARVHYHKFTRGKDLSRYSEKDLANIFGKKSLKAEKTIEVKQDQVESSMEKLERESDFLINAGSMRDYFKKKLPNFGKTNGFTVGSNGVLKKEESDLESEFRPSFSVNTNVNSDMEDSNQYVGFGFKSDANIENEPKSGTNLKSTFISYVNALEDASPKKKVKKDKGAVDTNINVNLGLSNPAFNPMYTPIQMKKHILMPIEESLSEETLEAEEDVNDRNDEKRRKKPLQNLVEIVAENHMEINGNFLAVDNPNFEDDSRMSINESQIQENPYEVKVPKKKKQKKSSDSDFGMQSEESINLEKVKTKKNKKKGKMVEASEEVEELERLQKKKSREADAIENLAFNISIEEEKKIKKNLELENPMVMNESRNVEALTIENLEFDITMNVGEESIIGENPYEVKKKGKKVKRAVENSAVDDIIDSLDNPFEIRKKKKENRGAVENPAFDDTLDSFADESQREENPYEVKKKKKEKTTYLQNSYVAKKKKKKDLKGAVENPAFNDDSIEYGQHIEYRNKEKEQCGGEIELERNTCTEIGTFEVKRKKKKAKKTVENGLENPALSLETSSDGITENTSLKIEESDLMLNIVSTPIASSLKGSKGEETFSAKTAKRRKSVRFSNVTQERIIPNNDDLKTMSNNEHFDIDTLVSNGSLEDQTRSDYGVDNVAFDQHKNRLEENLDNISKTLDRYQAEIENDINEKKLEDFHMDDIVVGEVGNPHGTNEKLPDGTRLKFKYANFVSSVPSFHLDKTGSKKSYRHLIKGDIVVKFKNTNLHQIEGYAVKKGGVV